MVECTLVKTSLAETKADAVAVGLVEGFDVSKQPLRAADKALGGAIAELASLHVFRGKAKETHIVPTRGNFAAPLVLLVGLGKPNDFKLDTLRDVSARAALAARGHRLKTLAMPVLAPPNFKGSPRDHGQAVAEGVSLALFEFREFKSDGEKEDEPHKKLEAVRVVEPRAARRDALKAGIRDGLIIAEATNLARTLIMRPSLYKAPQELARVAQAEARKARVRCQVLGPAEMRRAGLGALLGVGAGSARPPRLVVLEWKGGKRKVLLCGKGIVFDSGGINIKPSDGMEKMKYDMSGSAAVLGAVLAAARLKVPVHLMAIMALAENMPSGSAIRPGDVLTAYNKKTIEVANTDAEGRLVLADALSYGVDRFKPDVVVDIATLTGAVRVALGAITTGVLGDDPVVQSLIAAGQRTGDDLWRLPLHKGYEKQVRSDIADVKNMGVSGLAGTIAGAAFLRQFVGDHQWAHLDIAGTSWTEKGPGDLQKEYHPKGPTGMGVRLFVEWLRKGA